MLLLDRNRYHHEKPIHFEPRDFVKQTALAALAASVSPALAAEKKLPWKFCAFENRCCF